MAFQMKLPHIHTKLGIGNSEFWSRCIQLELIVNVITIIYLLCVCVSHAERITRSQ